MIVDILLDNSLYLYLLAVSVVVIILIIIIIVIFVGKKTKKKRYEDAVEQVLLQVTQTRNPDSNETDADMKHLFEDLIHSIIPEKKSITFEIASPNNSTTMHFYISVPDEYVDTVKTQVRRVFVRAQVQEVPDYTIFEPNGKSIFCDINLKDYYGLPIRTYKKSDTDTFSSILGIFSTASVEYSGMSLQIVLKKANRQKSSGSVAY